MRGKAMGEGRRRLAHPAQSRCRPTPRPRTSAWATPRRRSQPIKTFEQKIRLALARAAAAARTTSMPSAADRATRSASSPTAPRGEAGWKYYEMDASHNPHITCPQDLMATLTKIMAET